MLPWWTSLSSKTSLAKNIIDWAPVYCDIGRLFDDVACCVRSLNHLTVTRIQAGLNVAILACLLCINQRLYKIATVNAVMITCSEKHRTVMIDLLICIGLPLIQMAASKYQPFTLNQLIYADVMQNTLFRDIATTYSRTLDQLFRSFWYRKHLFVLRIAFGNRLHISRLLWYISWPMIIPWSRCSFDTVLTIYMFYKCQSQSSQFWSSHRNLNRSRYFRLTRLLAATTATGSSSSSVLQTPHPMHPSPPSLHAMVTTIAAVTALHYPAAHQMYFAEQQQPQPVGPIPQPLTYKCEPSTQSCL